jgi:hypothetical protein
LRYETADQPICRERGRLSKNLQPAEMSAEGVKGRMPFLPRRDTDAFSFHRQSAQ